MQADTVVYDFGSIAEWLSALGTIAATVVALWLALRDTSEQLDATLWTHDATFSLIVINVGAKPVVLSKIDFEFGRFRPIADGSMEVFLTRRALPKTLAIGEDFQGNMVLNYTPSFLPDRLYKQRRARIIGNRRLFFVATTGSAQRPLH